MTTTMGLTINHCTLLIILFSWQFYNYASTCPDVCVCANVTSCQKCSYNVTFKNITKNYHELMCCGEDMKTSGWYGNYVNNTFGEISINSHTTCNASNTELHLPSIDTYSLIIFNTNFTKIKLKIKPQNLRNIDLSHNNLEYIARGVFNDFVYLRKLNLSKNKIINILEGSFVGLVKLETLDLSENKLTVLTNVFTPLKNLQHLNLSRNEIEFINQNYFNNWLLQHLDVSHNKLKKLAPGALQLLPNLARLLITDNPHLGITQLDTQMLLGTGRRLQQIDASRTGLYQVPEAFTHSVRFLTLSGNKISSIRCGDLDSYPLLQSLDFSNNKIVSVEDDSLGRLEMLLFLNINGNFLRNVPKTLPDELKYLSINNNIINNLTVSDLKGLPNLKILLLQNNQINYIQEHVFDDLLSLEVLDLSNNPLQMLSLSTFEGPLSLRDLRLCHLNLSVLYKEGSFPMSSPESLQMLHLQSSPGLARQLLSDSAALAAFSHLQYLDLRLNNLTEIRHDLLIYLVQLKTLRLHGNNINCTAELWLKDWMNKTMTNEESCYYSTVDSKDEVTKYNCTFSETFTISESLPPVNLYSTEMINKLLRYYGYLNNKTEKLSKKHFVQLQKDTETKSINPSIMDMFNDTNRKKDLTKKTLSNKLHYDSNTNESYMLKTKENSKMIDQNRLQTGQYSMDHRFLDIRSNLPLPIRNSRRDYDGDSNEIYPRNKSGKRLNTPVNITKKVNIGSILNKSKSNIVSASQLTELERVSVYESYTSNPNDKTEYSPFQQAHTNYAQYVGTIAVSSLIVISLILWASFRLKYKRNRIVKAEPETEEQIEVTNISGGVLW